MLRYQQGDATQPEGEGARIIVHVCNDIGSWGAGFVLALSQRWSAPQRAYRDWHRSGQPAFGLGEVQFVVVESQLWVANLIGQHGTRRSDSSDPPIRYDAIRSGLQRVRDFAIEQSATVHMPRIGTGLAGGRWDKVEPIIDETLISIGLDVVVYDLPPPGVEA